MYAGISIQIQASAVMYRNNRIRTPFIKRSSHRWIWIFCQKNYYFPGWWKTCEKVSPYFSPIKSIKETDPFPQMYFWNEILKWFKIIQNGFNLFDCINNSNTKGKQWQTNYTKWGLVLLLSLSITVWKLFEHKHT